ncbi:hypothetical protein EDD16DRAFT_1605755 [Pisolithus croceorrhizus]|nr:hypothetical protein EDD16DRAFT_1605755 [Pisolithus croceorrhizus]KAI6125545.1 hypothetical protein EV401DRAFT_1080846 [Pisolithus croceorrhizus]
MGVHGLTTYLRENKRVLGKTVHFPSASGDAVTTIVVDGWSFIFEIYLQSHLPWVYGGEYTEFSQYVEQVVLSWIAIGLKVYFAFDGPTPELKIPTLTSRMNGGTVEQSLIFFRTSPASRCTPRFLRETNILPPLAYEVCVQTLQRLASSGKRPLEVHFADEEADPYAVELAGRLGAYVVGNDSDFVIFSSGLYEGFISLDELMWILPDADGETYACKGRDRDDDFQTVVRGKARKPPTQQQNITSGLIPPADVPFEDLTLNASVYTPAALASHLKIPVTILPLLAALVGNDFSNQSSTQRNVQSLFFERKLSLSQRIAHTGNTLTGILNAASQPRKARHQVESVMDLITRTVNALLVRAPSHVAPGEVDAVVDRIVNAALKYAIDKYDGEIYGPDSLWPTRMCALHHQDACPFVTLFMRTHPCSSHGDTGNDSAALRLGAMYVEAFRSGKLKPKIADIMNTGAYWPKLFLENPDLETVAKSIGRPIRLWIYALLEDGVGLPDASEISSSVTDSVAEDDRGLHGEDGKNLDELIDVEEHLSDDDDTDLLAPLRGELERLRTADDSTSEPPASATSHSRSRLPPGPKNVTEYIRRGSRIAPDEVRVPDLAVLMSSSAFKAFIDSETYVPWQLRSLEERITLFLHILESNVPLMRDLPPVQLFGVLVVRWVIRTLHLRAVESGMTKDREKERWSQREARALLAFYIGSLEDNEAVGSTTAHGDAQAQQLAGVPIMDRTIQLMAQALTAIETIQCLSQVLFLSDWIPVNVEGLSSSRFHACISQPSPVSLPESMWNACVHSLEDAFRLEFPKKNRNAGMRKHDKPTRPLAQTRSGTVGNRRSAHFAVLGDAEA